MICIKDKADGTKKQMSNIGIVIQIVDMIKTTNEKRALTLWLLVCAASSISYVLTTWRIQIFFDSFNDENTISNLFWLGLVLMIGLILSGMSVWGDDFIEKRLIKEFRLKFCENVQLLDSEKMEDPEFINYLNQCEKGIINVAYIAQSVFFMATWHVPYLIFMGIYLYLSNPLFLCFFLLMAAGTFLIQLLKSKYYISLSQETRSAERRIRYYESCIFDLVFCKETRTFNLQKMFKKKINGAIFDYNEIYKKGSCKVNWIDLICRLIMSTVYVAIIIVLINDVINSKISVGTFTAILASIERIEIMIRSMLISNIGYMSENIGGAYSYVEFMKKSHDHRVEIKLNDSDDIILDNVSFKYPNGNREVLHEVSFSVRKSETIVIVGENGSGKSTLAKILIGLYSPSSGKIIIGNRLMKNGYHIVNSTVVFQDFCRYKFDINDNICISDPPAHINLEKGKVFDCDSGDVDELMNLFGLSEFNDSMSILSPEFGGKDVSGGTWQRIAIARSTYRKSKFIILDEPTAAIDPSEEERIYNAYNKISKNKKTIIISHRIGITRLADKIIVMKDGRVAGVGTHLKLLTENEEYKRLWDTQAKYYTN